MTNRTRYDCFFIAILIGAAAARDPLHAGQATPLTSRRIASDLAFPTFACAAPGDSTRLFLLEQFGRIRILDLATETFLPVPFLDIDSLVFNPQNIGDERGLLGMAFHPDYAQNGFFYLNYVTSQGDTRVARYTRSATDPNRADPASALQIYYLVQPFQNHKGGWLGFGPDGLLYISQGDGGGMCDPNQRAQNITTELLGKILRLDINTDGFPADPNRFYSIPPSNPFVGTDGLDEIWDYGLRNPWRCSFDRLTGDLYIADVGQQSWEEINFEPAGSPGGFNYGWDCMEGNHCSSLPFPNGSSCAVSACTCDDLALTPPIHEYPQSIPGPNNCSITGGHVYRGTAIPSLQGAYFFADYCTANIWSLRYDGAVVSDLTVRKAELDPPGALTIDAIVAFGEDAAGELYIIEYGTGANGELFKIIPNCPIGDIDGDCDRDETDLALFVAVLLGADSNPDHRYRADVDTIGGPNGADIQPYLTGYLAS